MMLLNMDVNDYRKPQHEIEPIFVERWSPRAMSGEAVSQAELDRLFEAARWAPSAFNEQPWRFLYAHRETPHWQTFFDLLVEGNQAWCKDAGALMVLVSKKTFSRNGAANAVHVFDAGSAWQSLALQGAKLGLVVHGMAGFDGDAARKVLKIPDDFTVCAMIAVGKPGRKDDLPEGLREIEAPSERKPVAEIAIEGGFAAG